MRPHHFDFNRYRRRGPYTPCPGPEVVELLRGAIGLLRQWLRRTRERDELAWLDWRLLRDIGVTPSEAAGECNKPFWRG
jgi:uncharacterized protein YjiS (DUF1127 family)